MIGPWVLGACSRASVVPAPEAGVEAGAPTPAVSESETPDVVLLEGVEHPGCFLLRSLDGGPVRQAGAQPCDERTTPASTFKIPHALIALDTGVVVDVDAQVEWDGKKRWNPVWDQPHSLRTAIYESVVWFFQGTARQIGRERMRQYLEAFEYGNARVEEPIDMFWLDGGSLEISPEEQLRFLTRLYREGPATPSGGASGGAAREGLPRGQEHVPMLRELLIRPPSSFAGRMPDGMTVPDAHPELVFSAKTGTDAVTTPHGEGSVTWLVGHVACPDRAHVFVSRVISEEEPQSDSPAAGHGLAALDQLGVLRCKTPWR
ncbi:penicillin-binding transpeptidase domain-containing protein [Paraliomyxa miuraensis]|uniref:penicillin-binding transpeptidase domain-containing protein n=1 Tax=Paraliomyxa miuraensis TaxID=376150 RepID=UPI00224FF6B6|nr:penicillin-binding transpeptidase domain-containing protein [Paraliomyxa miuraensis]MCX4246094.1 penicillin-binding transpeptidase domain-containing protein [Paraliomyxa miuraensis]